MPSRLRDLLTVLARWPRRLAAAACLLLAVVSMLGARADTTAADSTRPPAAPGPDRFGVPVQVAGTGDFVHAGDRVDLLAAPVDPADGAPPGPAPGKATPVAADLEVLRVSGGGSAPGAPDAVTLVVAADRTTALDLAAVAGRRLVAAAHLPP